MAAKKKLNSAYATGAIAVAAIAGGLTGSWTVFAVTTVVLVAAAIYSGDIRA
jgi:hypothetical protein